MIGIIGAMQAEVDLLKQIITDAKTETVGGVSFTSGLMHGREVVVAVSGIGKILSSICTQTMILTYSPSIVINTGVAGALDAGLKIGDIVIADSVLQHDLDMTSLGHPLGYVPEYDLTAIACDRSYHPVIYEYVTHLGFTAMSGVIASGDIFLSNAEIKEQIRSKFNAVACDMECAGIGFACYVNRIPFLVIRAISDGADELAKDSFENFLHLVSLRSAQLVETFVKNS